MPIFKSKNPPIDVPLDVTVWDWLYDQASPASPLARFPPDQLAGFTDAVTKTRVSWADVAQYSTYISTALVSNYQLQPQDTVALFSRNTVWYPVMLAGAVRCGARVSGASPAYNVEEMTYALKVAGAKFLATAPTSREVALAAAKAAGIPQKHIFMLEGSREECQGFTTIQDLIEQGRQARQQVESWKIPRGKTNGDVCAFLSFSSGTTGLPKAVMIAHKNVIAQSLQIEQITPSSHKRVLAVLPLFHITGLVHGLHLPVLLNAEVVMLPAFTMPDMLQTVQDYRIEDVLLVPPIIIRLVRDPIVDRYDLSCVKRWSSGAAPISDEILQLLRDKFPGTGFKQGYGMTESCSCITAHAPSHYDFRYAHSVGTVVASTEVKILKEDGSEADVGEPGEILGRGPQVVMGYLDNDRATRETFDADGWLHTGDQGVIDADGVVTITDRIKEMIKVKGIGVAPAELEDLLLGHAKVEDAAVLAIPDDYSGEVPKAFVVLKPGHEASEAVGRELLKYVRDNKTRHKHVRELEFATEIPKSASGKILRRVLRDKQKQSGGRGVVVRLASEIRARL